MKIRKLKGCWAGRFEELSSKKIHLLVQAGTAITRVKLNLKTKIPKHFKKNDPCWFVIVEENGVMKSQFYKRKILEPAADDQKLLAQNILEGEKHLRMKRYGYVGQ